VAGLRHFARRRTGGSRRHLVVERFQDDLWSALLTVECLELDDRESLLFGEWFELEQRETVVGRPPRAIDAG
jgi:hypothetical protein